MTRLIRGNSQTIVQTVDLAGPELDHIRAETQTRLQAALDEIRPSLSAQDLARSDHIMELWRATAPFHAQMLALAARPRQLREMKDTEAWYKSVGTVVDGLTGLSLSIAGNARWADPVIGENVLMRQYSWDLRESLGDECSSTRAAFGPNGSVTPAIQETIISARSAARRSMRNMTDLLARPGAPADLVTAAQQAQTDMQQAFAERNAAYATLATADRMQGADWNTMCSARLAKVLNVADVAIKGMAVRAAQLRSDAIRTLMLIGTAFALSVAVGVAGLLLTRRRVVLPLRAVMAVLSRLAARQYDEPIPQPSRQFRRGVLVLQADGYADGVRRKWTEGRKQRLDRMIDEVTTGIEALLAVRKVKHEEIEERQRRYAEWSRRRELPRQREEREKKREAFLAEMMRLQREADDLEAWLARRPIGNSPQPMTATHVWWPGRQQGWQAFAKGLPPQVSEKHSTSQSCSRTSTTLTIRQECRRKAIPGVDTHG